MLVHNSLAKHHRERDKFPTDENYYHLPKTSPILGLFAPPVNGMACIIYWQAKVIHQVILEGEPERAGVDLSLLEHISPIGWENVTLYGQQVLNRSLVRP